MRLRGYGPALLFVLAMLFVFVRRSPPPAPPSPPSISDLPCKRSSSYLSALAQLPAVEADEFDPRHPHEWRRFQRPFLQRRLKKWRRGYNARRHVFIDLGTRDPLGNGSAIVYMQNKHPAMRDGVRFDIYAWEMDPAFHARIRDAIPRLRPHRLTLVPAAAWVADGRMEFAGSMALDGHQMGQLQAVGALPGAKNVSSVPTLDFGRWLRQTVQSHDYVAVKMDIEGAEFPLLDHLLATGVLCLVDELFVEIHFNRYQSTRPGRQQRPNTWSDVRRMGTRLVDEGQLYYHLWF